MGKIKNYDILRQEANIPLDEYNSLLLYYKNTDNPYVYAIETWKAGYTAKTIVLGYENLPSIWVYYLLVKDTPKSR